ncbi:M16 family metallopeptidase [Caulobacter sp. 17J65-9]|uniref:M16 family metallopeptidase n=1 Tax=Caulobacter sp. 17J65-9 TaxID=2709382 RepID=UPI0013CAF573|nr:M16 family metallopeptidase [Caulobacter sp. 17J65-9]NEX92435.1 insulinase family protein [Caulobacter sp. 17J65-9]
MNDLKRVLAAALIAGSTSGCAMVERVFHSDTPAPTRTAEAPVSPKPAAPAPVVAAQAPAAKTVWAQDGSDLVPDPAVRYGVLPNGMRYVLMKNATPPGQASLRLRVDAGSLNERDDQLGLAHFIEHMVFNGTSQVAEGDMVKILERAGLAFGPDTNAFTSFEQTVYQLDLPKTDESTVDTGLFLMREAAGEALLKSDAIDRERGVVLSEERTRDGPGMRIAHARYDFLLKGQLAPKRFPIGSTEVIKTAPREPLVDFYRAYYRPENTTLVAVGDFDVDAMEAKIKGRFANWTAQGPAGAKADQGQLAPRGQEAEVVVEPGGASTVQIGWLNPPDREPDTKADRRKALIRQLGFAVLNRRYERLARAGEPPFLGAAAYRYTELDSADVTLLTMTTQPGHWREAMTAAEQEERRIVKYGVLQEELDREISELRAALTQGVAGAATRRTPVLAAGLVDSVDDHEVYTSPADDLALFEETVKGLKAATVSETLKAQFAGQGPLVFVTSPTPIEGGETKVAQAFAQSQTAEVAPPTAVGAKTWAYTDFGPAGKVADERDVLDLETTFVRFENGVRLTVKPTKFRDDQILVSVRVGDGYLDLPKDHETSAWATSASFTEGGLGKLTAEEMEQVLASNVYGASLSLGEEAFTLSGRTRPEDFGLQMQVLTAYLTDPAWRPEPFQRARAYGATLHAQLESTPGGVLGRELASLVKNGDPRWAFPSREEMAKSSLDEVKSLVTGPLQNGPIEVVIVGDVNLDEAIRQTALTFGALPARHPVAPAADAAKVAFPAPNAQPLRFTHKGRADQGLAYVAWATPDFPSDPQRARTLRMLERVLDLRLTEELREHQSVTYSPSTAFESSWTFPGYGYLSASIEAPPEKLDGFFRDVAKIAADLRAKPPTADEMDRARRPRVEALEKAKATNEYWLGQLSGAQTDPKKLDAIRASIPGLERVTPADVQKAAQAYLTDKSWKLVVVPEAQLTKTGGAQ